MRTALFLVLLNYIVSNSDFIQENGITDGLAGFFIFLCICALVEDVRAAFGSSKVEVNQ